jgi:Putative MetA-pathway of phenol degradation
MKRVFSLPGLLALALLPLAAYAQQERQDSPAPQKEVISDHSGLETTTATASRDLGLEPNHARDLSLWSEQEAKAAQQKPKGPKTRSAEIERTPIEDSMVGYVDNAIIGSQIRVRFDAGFNDEHPDRDEFFYAKCGCSRAARGTPFFDPQASGPGTGIPEAINFQQLYFNVEYAPLLRFSVFSEVPIRWIQPQGFVPNLPFTPFGNQGGLSDVMFGFKLAALASSQHYLTFQFRTYAPSGNSFEGLGTAHWSVEPSLLYYQRLNDRWAIEGQLSDWHPINSAVGIPTLGSGSFGGDIFTYGLGPSYRLYRGERLQITPVLEMFGWHVISGFQTERPGGSDASGLNIVNLKAGFRLGFGHRNSVYMGFGQTVTHDFWYKHIARVEYRFTF